MKKRLAFGPLVLVAGGALGFLYMRSISRTAAGTAPSVVEIPQGGRVGIGDRWLTPG